jgi:hypothetical protein
LSGTASPLFPAVIDYWDFAFDVRGLVVPAKEDVSFTGPAGSGLNNAKCCHNEPSNGFYQTPLIAGPLLPPAGTYTVNFGTSTLRFEMGSQAHADQNIVMAVPSLAVVGGKIQKISWTYKFGNGANANIDLSSLMKDIQVQIDASGAACNSSQYGERAYDSPKLSPSATEVSLGCEMPFTKFLRLHIAYSDIFGNHYVTSWWP